MALVEFIANFTTYDLLGARLRNQMPISAWDVIRYPIEVSVVEGTHTSFTCLLNGEVDSILLYRPAMHYYRIQRRRSYCSVNSIC